LIWTSRSLSVTASLALADAVADEPLAFDRRLAFGRFDLVESQTFMTPRPKADQARCERVGGRSLKHLRNLALQHPRKPGFESRSSMCQTPFDWWIGQPG
jgi:hypothetical protein